MMIDQLRIVKSNLKFINDGSSTLEKTVDELIASKLDKLMVFNNNRVKLFLEKTSIQYTNMYKNTKDSSIVIEYDFGAVLVFYWKNEFGHILGFIKNNITPMELDSLDAANNFVKFVKAMTDAKHI